MVINRNTVDTTKFNRDVDLPFELRLKDLELAIQDIMTSSMMLIHI